jgi:nucleoside-diphosphate-sugar epimerase
VVGDAPKTPGGGPSEAIGGFVRLCAQLAWHSSTHTRAQLRMPGIKAARFNIVPVEYVADGIVAIAEAPEAAGGTFHLVSDAPTQDEWFSCVADRVGLPGLRVVTPRRGQVRGPTKLEMRVHSMLGRYLDYLAHDAEFDDSEAQKVLAVRGVLRPVLRGRQLVEFVDRALEG